ncbi:hypothetical protein C1645_827821 [Glomus cerebriforme]|uniref:F-box domain-containing protein n=1 Tax=Glomus cerebriforme TaxID=658196 RepID=A0A397SWX8_9GLOM|nr:hypothetical protein C1645_827821 [Glomus cerebriforme]
MSNLNKDVLYLIFEELQDDSKALFSCIMINRTWCEVGIPILWRNPWRYNINYSNKSYLSAVIFSYLSDDIREFLERQGIELPLILYQKNLFDYLSFCRSININVINSILSIISSLAYIQFPLQQELYELFMKKCTEFKYLDMRSIKHQIFCFPEAKVCLETLCELICDTSIDSTYFYGIARICQNIEIIVIINTSQIANHGIAKLIEFQENIKNFEWKDDIEEYYYFIDDPYEEILLALEKKANILNHIKIFFQYIDGYEHTLFQKVLPKFYKLKTLIIVGEFIFINEEQSKMFVFPELEILFIDCITINAASNIIENSGGHIKEILLFKYYDYFFEDNFDDDSLEFIHKIHEHCPLIEYLSLEFSPSKEHFIEFEKLLKVCQNLNTLLLNIFNFNEVETYEKILENGEELLKALIRSAPTNLREIRFFNDFKFSLEALEEFLKKWIGRPTLSIFTTDYIYEDDDYMKLINKYKDDRVIKDFRFTLTYEILYSRSNI